MNSKRSIFPFLWAVLVAVLIAASVPAVALAATTTTVTNEAELRAAVNQGSAAGNIKLANDIALNETLDLGACTTNGDSDRTVAIDLAGHKLEAGSDTVKQGAVIVVPKGYALTVRDSVSGNKGSITGGARGVENRGSFTLATGGIRNNSGQNGGNGLFNSETGVATITGGVIEGNVAQAKHDGAGVYNRGKLQMTGGVIQNNRTDTDNGSEGYGGGVYNGKGGNFTLSGGTIQGNAAERGAGVYNDPECEAMVVMGRARIQSNTATNQGGGIFNGKSGGGTKLALLGGVITDNAAGDCGGGIANIGVMAASAGVISNNTAARYGGGVYDEGDLLLSGSIVIKGNTGAKGVDNDTYLVKGKRITLEKAFNSTAKVGVVCEDPHQLFTKDFKNTNPDAAPDANFFPNPNGDQNDTRFFWDEDDEPGELRCVVVIHYRDASGGDYECINYEDATSDHWGEFGETRWFVVRESATIRDDIGVRGDVNLILCSGKTLITEGIGIRRQPDKGDRAKLTIWNSVGEDGYLIADATDSDSAGIGYKEDSGGVGTLVVNGGNIKALGGDDAAGIGGVENRGNGPITINGGYVEAHGGKWGAGIGGGQGGDQDNPIKINGGTVKAYGGKYAAGIGGGDSDRGGADGGKVVIKNATVYAQGGSRGAGIGGGEDGEGGNVTIENSYVEAHGGYQGAGIGGGQDSHDGGTLTVESGTVKAYGGEEAAGIGGGEDSCGGDFIANGGTIFAMAGKNCATGIGAGHGDYHEGTKQLYDRAKVTSSRNHTESPNDVRPAADRLEGLTWHSVLIEPCDHPDGATYTDISPEKHKVSTDCAYCGLVQGEEREEAHSFNSKHICACEHTEVPIVLMRSEDDTTPMKTIYQSSGSEYTLMFLGLYGPEKIFDHWKVSGAKDVNTGVMLPNDYVMQAGQKIAVPSASEASQVTLTAQWKSTGICAPHTMEYKPAQAATCTEDGNIEHWQCTKCNRLFADERGSNEISEAAVVIEALGHEWGKTTYTMSDDFTSCTAQHSCQREGCGKTKSETSWIVFGPMTRAATCTEKGGTFYLPFFLDPEFKSERYYVGGATDPTGHSWGEPTYTWSDDYSTCTATRTCGNDTTHVETETVVSRLISTQSTCATYTATFENPAFETQTVEGHKWLTPTYTWNEDYTACTATRVCANDKNHVQTEEATVIVSTPIKPTCTSAGMGIYTAQFTNEAFMMQLKVAEIAALGHDWGEWRTTRPPTQTEEGREERTCKNDTTHTQTRVIPVTSHVHKVTKVERREATCTEDGNIEYWVCDQGEHPCGRFFSDEGATHEIDEDKTILPAGHKWNEPRYSWNSDNTTCIAMRICASNPTHFQIGVGLVVTSVDSQRACSDPRKVTLVATFANPAFATQVKNSSLDHTWGAWEQAKAPTCEEPGEEKHVCSACGAEETREVAALGHTWGPWRLVRAATQDEEGLEQRFCETDLSHVDYRAIPKTTHVHGLTKVPVKLPTCTEPGNIEYWACTQGDAPCGRFFADAAGTWSLSEDAVVLTPLGHSWGEPVYEWSEDNATCTAKRVCERDASHEVSETVETTAVVNVPATCTEGATVTYTARFENKDFATQTKIVETDAHGHTPAANPVRENAVEPTCTTKGSYDSVTYCTTCNAEIARSHEVLAPLGHDWQVVTAPTCETSGEEKCARETDPEHATTRVVPALGHDWGSWQVVTPAGESTNGSEARVCANDPAHIQNRVIPAGNHTHTLVHHREERSPCGVLEYWKCEPEGCGRYFVPVKEGETPQVIVEEPASVFIGLKEAEWEDIAMQADHKWDEGQVTTPPTCTIEGERTFTCEVCGASKTEILEPTGHTEGAWSRESFEEQFNPTCETPGLAWEVLRCGVEGCGQELWRRLVKTEPLGHDWGEWMVIQEATETEEGAAKRECKRDHSHTETIVVGATGHSWGEPTYTWSSDLGTCTATHTCTLCNTSESATVQTIATISKDATCEEQGETTYIALFSDAAFSVQTKTLANIEALGHDWGEWEITTPATENSEGVETRTCLRCGQTETRAYAGADLYRVVDGDGSIWTKGSGEVLVFTVKRAADDGTTFDLFTGIEVDGTVVLEEDASGKVNYTTKSGSLVLSLQPAFLETLDEGEHTVKVLFDDGSTEASFKVATKEASASDESGDADADTKAAPAPDESSESDDSNAGAKGTSAKTGDSDAGAKGASAKTGDSLMGLSAFILALMAVSGLCLVLSGVSIRQRRNE